MSERSLKRVLTVLGVLVVAWIVVTAVRRFGTFGGEEAVGEMEALLDSLDLDRVRAISFSDADGSEAVRLAWAERAPTGWTVEGHPVDSVRIGALYSTLRGISTEGLVSVNPVNHARLGIDEEGARRMVLEREDGADTLLLGKTGPSTRSIYARLPGRPEVHLLDAWLEPHATRDVDEWRSRRMTALDTSTVAVVEVRRGATAYRLERSDSLWTVDGDRADSTLVRSLMSEIASLRANGFPVDSASASEDTDVSRVVTVTDAGGSELLVVRIREAGDSGGSDPTAVVDGAAALQPGTPFTLPTGRADRLAPEGRAIREGNRPDGA